MDLRNDSDSFKWIASPFAVAIIYRTGKQQGILKWELLLKAG
jgi:hypothetical protein